MSEYLSEKIVDKMINNDVIDVQQRDEYLYTVQLLIEKCIVYVIVGFFAVLVGKIIETLLFLLVFLTIRKYSGGYHCKTEIGCVISSLILVVVVILIEGPFLQVHRIAANVFFALSVCIMLVIGPVNHPNMNWSEYEYDRSKRVTAIMVLIWTALIICSELIGLSFEMTIYCRIGVVNAVILILLAKIKKQEVKHYGQEGGESIT